jgi:hypothetical protein
MLSIKMEKEKLQPIHSVIIILLVANLIATIWFGLTDHPSNKSLSLNKEVEQELPSVITPEVRADLYSQFAKAFNASDYDAFYDMFGPVAKAQFTKESSDETLKKMVTYFHSAESGAYTHSELVRNQGDTKIYNMYYAVKLHESSVFGAKGVLKITIAVNGSEYQIYGMRLNAG